MSPLLPQIIPWRSAPSSGLKSEEEVVIDWLKLGCVCFLQTPEPEKRPFGSITSSEGSVGHNLLWRGLAHKGRCSEAMKVSCRLLPSYLARTLLPKLTPQKCSFHLTHCNCLSKIVACPFPQGERAALAASSVCPPAPHLGRLGVCSRFVTDLCVD